LSSFGGQAVRRQVSRVVERSGQELVVGHHPVDEPQLRRFFGVDPPPAQQEFGRARVPDDPREQPRRAVLGVEPAAGEGRGDPAQPPRHRLHLRHRRRPEGVVHTHRNLSCEVRDYMAQFFYRQKPALMGSPVST
jgi:hypothetical protein